MNQKQYPSIYHVNVNVKLIEQNVIEINAGIKKIVDVTVENIIYVKKLCLECLYI